ncbi:hypothetical protein AGDE_12936 [Angomonas deanei]|uniref:IQ calmodulin-binding motif containing protein, putative n=1 Tax=Angomonas deanei TaxID=59799 RepID=A0A7G2CKK9_9TRYP|nr:hypothetical protein AGDE_12936 [Angomonas deanei]CAD2218742.1 IQ calmodulin-binding motif containing protein, putative [Angomonas deanei]|eukprot:EPY23228.1 hypothetical protein AGDE_12936 [Angomonas deanei]
MERYHAQLAAGCAATYLHPTHPLQQRCLNRVASVESTRPPVPANDATRELVPPQLPLRPQGAVHAPRRFGTRVIPVSALLVCIEQVKVPRELQTYLSAVQRYISKTPLPPTPKTGDAHLIPQPPLLPSVRSRAAPPKKIERIITTVDRSSNDKYEQLKRSTAASLADPFLSEYLLCMDTELKRFSKIIVTDQKRKTKVTPHEAAKRIQCFYRRYRFRLHRRARSSERTEAPAAPLSPDSAARRIQTQYRLYRYRRGGRTKERTPHTRDSAATKIQAMWRMYVTRRQCAEKVQYLQWDRHVAATRIQRRWRCYWAQARCTDRWMMNLCHEKSSQASQHLMCSVIRFSLPCACSSLVCTSSDEGCGACSRWCGRPCRLPPRRSRPRFPRLLPTTIVSLSRRRTGPKRRVPRVTERKPTLASTGSASPA